MQHTGASIIWKPLSTMQFSLERFVRNILYLQQLAMQLMPMIQSPGGALKGRFFSYSVV